MCNDITRSDRKLKMAAVPTCQTLARQDALFQGRGRSERRGESYSLPYIEPLGDARTKLADFFIILLEQEVMAA